MRRLFIKFLLSQVLILTVFAVTSILATGYYKGRLAEQLSAAFRFSLVSGDTRQILYDMSNSVSKNFEGMSWRAGNGSGDFSIPDNRNGFHRFIYSAVTVPIFFDEDGAFPAGKLSFYYNRWPLIGIAGIVWLFIFICSWFFIGIERARIVKEYQTSLELQTKESQVVLAAQVAHDIRSPLAALNSVLNDLSALPLEKRELVNGAVGRIGEIARSLLENYRKPGVNAETSDKLSQNYLRPIIEPVLAEKRAQYASRPEIKIEFTAADASANVRPAELRRIISNLVNNAVEAFDNGGRVSVRLSRLDSRVLLEVSDDGKGISPEILVKLGQKGETHGKAGGTGLGLYHARTTVESWGGTFKITSEPNKGTSVKIELPCFHQPPVQAAPPTYVVLLDDDILVHMNWKMSAKNAGVALKAYKTPEEFSAAAGSMPKDTKIYIDSELGNGARGENIAKALHNEGFTDLTMATGHSAEKFARLPWLKVAGKEPPFNNRSQDTAAC